MIKIWPGMSLGDFLMQEVPDDWPKEEFYWQPDLFTSHVTICRKCGNPCRGGYKWVPKYDCAKCPDGYDGGIP